ncbi:hypothetical protein CEXT_525551 [Caerostris extrusa]|uniref:Uncharacterized protein n=1 Tax=Caerostris extrusa TaxID=172846 RepID=A0AAV4Y037_CAEEX|nr:hypothetical protein CEXT_525551 [Caerostris extrusa]
MESFFFIFSCALREKFRFALLARIRDAQDEVMENAFPDPDGNSDWMVGRRRARQGWLLTIDERTTDSTNTFWDGSSYKSISQCMAANNTH